MFYQIAYAFCHCRRLCLAAAFPLLCLFSPFASAQSYNPPTQCDGTDYISLGNTTVNGVTIPRGDNALFELTHDPADAVYDLDQVTDISTRGYNSLAYNLQDGYLYAGSGNQIWTIQSDGQLASVGIPTPGPDATRPFESGYAGDIDHHGHYFIGRGNRNYLSVVDLNSPTLEYRTLNITVNGNPYNMNAGDWAFDPADGYLYAKSSGYDLLRIDIITGDTTVLTVASTSPAGPAGGSWFDAEGNMYAYFNRGEIYRYDIRNPDPVTGIIPEEFVGVAPRVSSSDGAACAYRPIFRKTVEPDPGTPGQPVTYTFKIINVLPNDFTFSFFDTLSNAALSPHFPGATWHSGTVTCTATSSEPGFVESDYCDTVVPVLSNNDEDITINGLLVPPSGELTFTVEVDTDGAMTETLVCNQASLVTTDVGNPAFDFEFIGLEIMSDDPIASGLDDPSCSAFGTVDLTCSASDIGGGLFIAGETTEIIFTLDNNGTAPAQQIRLVEALLGGVTVDISVYDPDINCTPDGTIGDSCGIQTVPPNAMSYEIRDVNIGATGEIIFTVPVNFPSTYLTDTYTFAPTITLGGDPLGAACAPSIELTRVDEVDISVTKESYPDVTAHSNNQPQSLFDPGDNGIYVLSFANAGPANGYGISWTDQLPDMFTYTSHSFNCSSGCTAGTPSCDVSASYAVATNTLPGQLDLDAGCQVDVIVQGSYQ